MHDGGRDAGALASGDAAGIRIDALHEVGGSHGWDMPCMTQLIAHSAGGATSASCWLKHCISAVILQLCTDTSPLREATRGRSLTSLLSYVIGFSAPLYAARLFI